eukprot:437305_1
MKTYVSRHTFLNHKLTTGSTFELCTIWIIHINHHTHLMAFLNVCMDCISDRNIRNGKKLGNVTITKNFWYYCNKKKEDSDLKRNQNYHSKLPFHDLFLDDM